MAEPFLSEIRIMSFAAPPKGWAACDGQFLPINQNQALFALLGTTYGGNGQTTFALPNLQGRVPIHFDSGHTLGQRAGEDFHTLSLNEMPEHTHVTNAANAAATTLIPNNTVLLAQGEFEIYRPATNLGAMKPGTTSNVGGSQPHENRQPFLALNFCIALIGIFPSPN